MIPPVTSLFLLPTNLLVAEDPIPDTSKKETDSSAEQHASLIGEIPVNEEDKKAQSIIKRFFCCGNSEQELHAQAILCQSSILLENDL